MASVSVILPTYNEKDNIVHLINDIHGELSSIDHEIIVVDDSSADGTFDELEKLDYPYLKSFLRTQDRGLASSIKYGIDRASGERLLIMDSDYNHQPLYIVPMIEMLRECDCAVASRFIEGGAMDSRLRGFLSNCFNGFIRSVTGGRLSDYLYGYLAIRHDRFKTLKTDDIFYGFGDYCIRLLLRMEDNGFTIRELPAVNGKRRSGKSSSFLPKTFLDYFRETLKLSRRRRPAGRV